MRKMIKMVELYILDEYGSASAELFRDLVEGDREVVHQTKADMQELASVLDSIIDGEIFQSTVEFNELVELRDEIETTHNL